MAYPVWLLSEENQKKAICDKKNVLASTFRKYTL